MDLLWTSMDSSEESIGGDDSSSTTMFPLPSGFADGFWLKLAISIAKLPSSNERLASVTAVRRLSGFWLLATADFRSTWRASVEAWVNALRGYGGTEEVFSRENEAPNLRLPALAPRGANSSSTPKLGDWLRARLLVSRSRSPAFWPKWAAALKNRSLDL